jgi:ABC-type transport system involved in multi-copper enzyme maturation permease subunit
VGTDSRDRKKRGKARTAEERGSSSRRGSPLGRFKLDLRGWRTVFRQQVRSEVRDVRFFVIIAVYAFAAIAGGYGTSTGWQDRWDNTDPSMDLFMLSAITAFFASLIGVVVSFDMFSRERSNGTFQTMLVHPVSREAVYLGRVLAVFVPLYAVTAYLNAFGIAVIGMNVGLPGAVQSLTFIFIAPTVALVFVLLLGGMSFRYRSSQVLLRGIAIWIFFIPLIWVLVPESLGFAAGHEVTTATVADPMSDFNKFANWIDMANPLLASVGMVAVTGNVAAHEWVFGIPTILPFASLAVWLLLSLGLGIRYVRSFGKNRKKRRHFFSWLPHSGQ